MEYDMKSKKDLKKKEIWPEVWFKDLYDLSNPSPVENLLKSGTIKLMLFITAYPEIVVFLLVLLLLVNLS